MLTSRLSTTRRRGFIAPLTALLLVPLLGMLAFAIDIGYICVVQSDLQNAADAAALAGAEKLQPLYVEYYQANTSAAAQAAIIALATTNTHTFISPMYTAEQFSSYNMAGSKNITVPDSDVSFGFTDAQGNYTPYSTGSAFPNTITVITRRDNTANGPLPLFFGRLFGVGNEYLTATASATIYAGEISSMTPIPGVDSHILPVTLDYYEWLAFRATGISPDGTFQTRTNPEGVTVPEIQVYPDPKQAPGQFSLLDIGPPQNNVPAFRTWIDNGATPNDISYLNTTKDINGYLMLPPVPAATGTTGPDASPISPTNSREWKGGPGLKSTLLTNFQNEMWKPNLLPLFIPVSVTPYQAAQGQGQGSYYAIVGFVGVRISQAEGNGNNMNISVQPYGDIWSNTIIANAKPAGTQLTSVYGGTMTTFISAKLTK